MKKIFSKEIFLSIAPLLVSLFLFPNIAKADTINITFSDSDFSVLNETFYSLREIAITYCSTNNCKYGIVYFPNSRYEISYLDNNDTLSYSYAGSNVWYVANTFGSPQFTTCVYNLNGVQTSCSTNTWGNGGKLARTSDYGITISQFVLLDTNFVFNNPSTSSGDNIYNFTYNNYSFTISPSNPIIPSYYEIYTRGNEIPDDTPLLTQFFTISIEKLQVICDFIVSSYIYLAVIVIFLIYCSIYLLRRLK